MPFDNRIVVASAGSGKTTLIVDDACGLPEKRAAMITYTNNGRDEIEATTYRSFGHVPPHVFISTWFTFLLRHFVRPYQNCLYDLRVAGIRFVSNRSALKVPAQNIRHHYFSRPDLIYSDKIAEFACAVIEKSNGAPIRRFESKNGNVTGHDGVFAVRESDVAAYNEKFQPQALRYNRKTMTLATRPLNFGAAKGMTFDRTIIYPHGPLKKFLTTGKLNDAGKELDKIYVAITRARQSVAFVVEDGAKLAGLKLYEIN